MADERELFEELADHLAVQGHDTPRFLKVTLGTAVVAPVASAWAVARQRRSSLPRIRKG
jgi:hypothetical protein